MFDAISKFFDFLNGLSNGGTAVTVFIAVLVILLITFSLIFLYLKNKKKLENIIIEKSKEIQEDETNKELIKKHDESIKDIKGEIEIIKKDVEEAKHDISQTRNEINTVSSNIDIMICKLDGFIQKDKERTVITFRNNLWKMHRDFMQQGYVTPTDLKNFNEMVTEYEECGGNDIVHEKLKPEIVELPVRYQEGSY